MGQVKEPTKADWGNEYQKELRNYSVPQEKLKGFLYQTAAPAVFSLLKAAEIIDVRPRQMMTLGRA